MDKEYWENFYNNQDPSNKPSDFATFCAKKYSIEFGDFYDIGCGNGRDSLFFSTQLIPTIGIDQCVDAIKKNKVKATEKNLKVNFVQGDFSTFNYEKFSSGSYSIYSRFTLHAINYEEEEKLFQHLNSSKRLKYFAIEARSINDDLYGKGVRLGMHEYMTTHYRRFIDPNQLKKILSTNFTIEFFEENKGFAKTELEDPCLIRVIAKHI